ncbi:hypothetical protein [Hoylesella timonensis]|uniref:hypothetical protein n=1 Tax=Hoylesella timonensis TaxID=386414 RepID=UPI0002FAB7DB|nr:hypothetical protein [Hoylesella timonensis]
MSKTEITAARRKSAYICPKIVCIAVEYSLCAASPIGGGAGTADYDGLLEEDEQKEIPMN